jgi:hypothetical protein
MDRSYLCNGPITSSQQVLLSSLIFGNPFFWIAQEVACISAATNKWLDANEFLAGRLQLKQQKAAGQQF